MRRGRDGEGEEEEGGMQRGRDGEGDEEEGGMRRGRDGEGEEEEVVGLRRGRDGEEEEEVGLRRGLEEEGEKEDRGTCHACAGSGRVLYQFVTLYRGWKTYVGYRVALAGLALAFLYMTVLDFHHITVGELGFCFSHGSV